MYGTLGDSSAFYGNKVGEAMSHVCVASGFLDFWLSWIFFSELKCNLVLLFNFFCTGCGCNWKLPLIAMGN
jgi:hypothetical protein